MAAEIEKLIECGVCLEILDDSHKMLPCQHSFHKSCLENIIRKQIHLFCPICRMFVAAPIYKLKNNIMVSGLIDCYKKGALGKPEDAEEKELALALALSRKEFEKEKANSRKSTKTNKTKQIPIPSVGIEGNSRKSSRPSNAKQNQIPSVDNVSCPPLLSTFNYHLPPPLILGSSNTFSYPPFQSSMPCPQFSFTSAPPPTSLPASLQPSTHSSRISDSSMLTMSVCSNASLLGPGGSICYLNHAPGTSSSSRSNDISCRPPTLLRSAIPKW